MLQNAAQGPPQCSFHPVWGLVHQENSKLKWCPWADSHQITLGWQYHIVTAELWWETEANCKGTGTTVVFSHPLLNEAQVALFQKWSLANFCGPPLYKPQAPKASFRYCHLLIHLCIWALLAHCITFEPFWLTALPTSPFFSLTQQQGMKTMKKASSHPATPTIQVTRMKRMTPKMFWMQGK